MQLLNGTFDRIPLISNNTPFEIKIYEGYGGVFRERSSIPAGGKLAFRHLGREFEYRSSLDKFESVVYATASDEDLNEVAEIRFIYQTQDNILTFDVIPRGLSKEVSFHHLTFTHCCTLSRWLSSVSEQARLNDSCICFILGPCYSETCQGQGFFENR